MKGTHNFALIGVTCSIKKSVTLIHDLKCFFVPSDMWVRQLAISFHESVAGLLVDHKHISLQSRPATVSISDRDFDCGGLRSFQLSSLRDFVLAGRFLFHCHFV